jgi:hypothetical protein
MSVKCTPSISDTYFTYKLSWSRMEICNINSCGIYRRLGSQSVGLERFVWLNNQLQIRSAQHKTPVCLVKVSMCFLSALGPCCFHPFNAPRTCVIITDPSMETTLAAIARFAFPQFGHIAIFILCNQVSNHICPFPVVLHATTVKLLPPQGCALKLTTISVRLWVVYFP